MKTVCFSVFFLAKRMVFLVHSNYFLPGKKNA